MKPPPAWNEGPAFPTLLAKFAELYTRALRVDAVRRDQARAKLSRLIEKRPTR